MAGNKKMELVRNTYELLKTTSPNDIKIRTIAANSNCTTTTVYKHFDDLNHLILFSSIKFLEDYIIELQNITNENMNPLDMLEAMWDSFAKYAFSTFHTFAIIITPLGARLFACTPSRRHLSPGRVKVSFPVGAKLLKAL